MKKIKSAISILLTLLLLLSVITVAQSTVLAAAISDTENLSANNPAFVAESVTAKQGQKNVAVKVSFKNNPGIASVKLMIHYNENAMTLTNFTYNTTALNGAGTIPFMEGVNPCLYMVNGTADVTGDIEFATLYFEIADNASVTYDIDFSYDEDDVYNIKEKNVAFEIVKGKIAVQGGENPTTPVIGDNPAFVAESVSAKPGQKNIAVNVFFKNNPGIASAKLMLHYNKSALTLTNFTYNTTELNGAATIPFMAGVNPCLYMVNGTADVTGDITFATLFFDVADNATGNYSISFIYDEDDVYNIKEDNVEFMVVNGSINVIGDKPEYKYGDVNGNGVIDITDATYVQQIAAEIFKPTNTQKICGDVNGSGNIEITDATLIQTYVAEMINIFPVEKT